MAAQIGNLMANFRPRIVLNQATYIRRSLAGIGEINVSPGAEVAPQDIIGRSSQSSGYSSVKLSRLLGVGSADAVKYLRKPLGATIFKGELLAYKKGLIFNKTILSPTDGVLEKYDTSSGELRLRFLVKQAPLTAGVFGIVENVDKAKGEVLVKSMATLIYGVVGFGFERGGILQILGDSTSPIRSGQITPSLSQHILVAGALMFRDALKKAAGLGILGVISGGINSADYRAMAGSLDLSERLENDVGVTILVTEGFGPLPLGEDILKLLRSYEGKFMFVNGNDHQITLPNYSSEGLMNLRKISLPIPRAGGNLPDSLLGELEAGRLIRFISAPLMGMQGKIIGIDSTPTLLESGISTYMVTVETVHNKIRVPFPNIELIS